MNIGHRINARKITLCYIYWDLFYQEREQEWKNKDEEVKIKEKRNYGLEKDEHGEIMNVDHDFLASMGVFATESNQATWEDEEQDEVWVFGLWELEDDLSVIANALRMEPLEIDREYIYNIIWSYSAYNQSIEKLVDQYVTQFQWKDMELLKKSIFLLGYTEKKILDTDAKVIVNEMVELAKRFGGYETYKLVNSILHKLII
jgi:N utilization substance protein B